MHISYLLAIFKMADYMICRVVEMSTIAEITPNQTNVLNQMKTDFQPAKATHKYFSSNIL